MLRSLQILIVALALGACVTVNVYFPEAAAENAADRIVREIYDIEEPPAGEPEASLAPGERALLIVAARTLEWLVPAAQAQEPNIDVSTPAIRSLVAAMDARDDRMKPYFASGALGLDANGLVTVRDSASIPIRDRNSVNRLIVEENADRNDLYREIASANGHPEWEPRIRRIFGGRFISNAPGGWWYQNPNGTWVQK